MKSKGVKNEKRERSGTDFCITLYFTVLRSSVTELMMKNLTGTEGGNITLPYHVVQSGFLSFGANVIANVRKGEIQILEEMYRNRLLWNKDTGFFTLTGLQRNDSGNYALSSTILYKLTVYGELTYPLPVY